MSMQMLVWVSNVYHYNDTSVGCEGLLCYEPSLSVLNVAGKLWIGLSNKAKFANWSEVRLEGR